jgi:hypothetical protein
MGDHGERIATLEAENDHMKAAIKDMGERLGKVEKTIWAACGALGLLQIVLNYVKH